MTTATLDAPAPPRVALGQLAALRRREAASRLAWGAARLFGIAVAALLAACLADWLIDRRQDTPFALRVLMSLAQLAALTVGGYLLLVRPARRGLEDDRLARLVEKKLPAFGHRLVTAVQLTRPAARTDGMSPELIAAVAREADDEAGRHDFAGLATDRRRASVTAALPAAVALALAFAVAPATMAALVARQLLLDVPVPRGVRLELAPSMRELQPAGDAVELVFVATGKVRDDMTGTVRVRPDGLPPETYPLTHKGTDETGAARFAAAVPPSSVSFFYRAWLGDGRTRKDARITFEPRPVVSRVDAFVLLPTFLGTRPDGSRFEQPQPQGEVVGIKGCGVRVAAEIQKPVARATLELLGRTGTADVAEVVLGNVEMALVDGDRRAEASFELKPNMTAYRVLVEDKYGFASSSPPRRGLSQAADEPPVVALLPERFPAVGDSGPAEDAEVDGMPVPVGGRIRVAYFCRSPAGLGKATFVYRVNEGPWRRLPLGEVVATKEAGPFDPRRGAFERSGLNDQVEFHAAPSPEPDRVPGRLDGGGRFDFQTKAVPELQVGDQVEYLVEATDLDPEPGRPAGRSEPRVKTVVSEAQFIAWIDQTLQQESRLRQLEEKQRGVFERNR